MENEIILKPTIGNTMLVSAFPGTGKSHYVNNDAKYLPDNFSTDSDSSTFDKEEFPENYIEHIKNKIEQGYSRVFISSHKEVRDALVKHNLPFVLVYPKKELKQEYLDRYKKRNSTPEFISLLRNNWDDWMNDLREQEGCYHIELESGQFLSNVV